MSHASHACLFASVRVCSRARACRARDFFSRVLHRCSSLAHTQHDVCMLDLPMCTTCACDLLGMCVGLFHTYMMPNLQENLSTRLVLVFHTGESPVGARTPSRTFGCSFVCVKKFTYVTCAPFSYLRTDNLFWSRS